MTIDHGKWILSGTTGAASGREFVLLGDEIRVGRTSENDIVLAERNVSRHHVLLIPTKTGCTVRDLQSKNGTFVNEKRTEEATLSESDTLRIGECRFQLTFEAEKPKDLKGTATNVHRPFAWKEKLNSMIEKVKSAKSVRPNRRAMLYSGAGCIVMIALFISTGQSSAPNSEKSPKKEEAIKTEPAKKLEPVESVTQDELRSWKRQAEIALKRDDLLAAIPILRKVISAEPYDRKMKQKLTTAEERLQAIISEYYESGAREYDKLNYDRAVSAWRKVIAMAQGFDQETYARAEEKLNEARQKLADIR